MNISQHSILPIRWKAGQCNFNGVVSTDYTLDKCLTHWFPIDTTGLSIFLIPSNAIDLYGTINGYPPTGSAQPLSSPLRFNCNIFDRYTPILPSKPFTYILVK